MIVLRVYDQLGIPFSRQLTKEDKLQDSTAFRKRDFVLSVL